MQRAYHIFFLSGEPPGNPVPGDDPLKDLSLDDDLPEDDIDTLFKTLQPVNPPSFLVDQILGSMLQRIPPRAQEKDQAPWSDEQFLDSLDSLVVRREHLPPS